MFLSDAVEHDLMCQPGVGALLPANHPLVTDGGGWWLGNVGRIDWAMDPPRAGRVWPLKVLTHNAHQTQPGRRVAHKGSIIGI